MTGEPTSAAAARIADLRLAIEAAVHAGERVALDFGGAMDVRMKSADQPVTETDLAVNRSLHLRLMGERPDYGWLSEETRDDPARLERDLVWIVDPIDGTSSFVAGHPDSVISIGLADGRSGLALVGVLFNPITGELYWAVRGAGAYGVLLQTARHEDVAPPLDRLCRIASVDDIGPDGWGRFMIVHDVKSEPRPPLRAFVSRADEHDSSVVPPGWVPVARGSTAYKMAGVASGAGDGYFASGPKSEWDVCAAGLIVEEAGGRATDLDGVDLRYNRRSTDIRGIVCGAEESVHAELLGWVRSGWQ
ncbi:MAG TPA: 3'(2'),5'-bisphosphate nucleotidase CysQ [Longimicrobiales bacterium]